MEFCRQISLSTAKIGWTSPLKAIPLSSYRASLEPASMNRQTNGIARGLGIWLVVATGFVAVGGVQLAPPPYPQIILVGLTALLFVLWIAVPSFSRAIAAV